MAGKIGFHPYFKKKNLAEFPCVETIKHHFPVLKFDFNKIELQVEIDFNKVKFYAYFAT